MNVPFLQYFYTKSAPKRVGLSHPSIVPYGAFLTKDNKNWPKFDSAILKKEKTNIAVQINGKTRHVLNLKKDLNTEEIQSFCSQDKKVMKYLNGKKINKVIHVKNKIINFLIQ